MQVGGVDVFGEGEPSLNLIKLGRRERGFPKRSVHMFANVLQGIGIRSIDGYTLRRIGDDIPITILKYTSQTTHEKSNHFRCSVH